jgi:hypothetical protein
MIALIIKQHNNKLAANGVNKGGQSKTLHHQQITGNNHQ